MPHEAFKVDSNSPVEKVSFDVVNERGDAVSVSDLPPGVRKIVFNKDDIIRAKEKTILTKKLGTLTGVEKIRQELDNLDSYQGELNSEETKKIAQEKVKAQEVLTGMKQQTTEVVNIQTNLEDNNDNLDNVAKDIFLEPNKNPTEKVVIETKELPEEWKGFKKAWFGPYVAKEDEYLSVAQQVKNFSEHLASKDPVFRRMLSQKIYENEKLDALNDFKGINEEGRLINKNGTLSNYPYMFVGLSLRRADYEQKLVESYATEKGFL